MVKLVIKTRHQAFVVIDFHWRDMYSELNLDPGLRLADKLATGLLPQSVRGTAPGPMQSRYLSTLLLSNEILIPFFGMSHASRERKAEGKYSPYVPRAPIVMSVGQAALPLSSGLASTQVPCRRSPIEWQCLRGH